MTKMTKWAFAAALGTLSLGLMAAPASAGIYIGLQEAGVNSGNITTEVSNQPGPIVTLGSTTYGTFTANSVTGTSESLPNLLGSTATNVSSATAGTLTVYVTLTGLTAPIGMEPFQSSFTSNTLPAGWSVTETSYLDSTNGVFTGTQLSSNTFTNIGTQVMTATGTTASPFSVTEKYVITSTAGVGTALSTINMAVPEPSVWAMMVLGVGGLGMMLRRRRAMAPTFA